MASGGWVYRGVHLIGFIHIIFAYSYIASIDEAIIYHLDEAFRNQMVQITIMIIIWYTIRIIIRITIWMKHYHLETG